MTSPETTDRRAADGLRGERIARWFLERRGYRFRDARVRMGRYEVDLVMQRGELIVFVEVKWRGRGSWCRALAAVRAPQRRRLALVAASCASRYGSGSARFDVIAIEDTETSFTVQHISDAFGAGGRCR